MDPLSSMCTFSHSTLICILYHLWARRTSGPSDIIFPVFRLRLVVYAQRRYTPSTSSSTNPLNQFTMLSHNIAKSGILMHAFVFTSHHPFDYTLLPDHLPLPSSLQNRADTAPNQFRALSSIDRCPYPRLLVVVYNGSGLGVVG